MNDTLQEFSDYPLDYQFPEDNEEEISVVDENGIGTYYAAVPVDYVFPAGIKTTILDELYIPEEDPYFVQYLKKEADQYAPDIPQNMTDFFNTLLLQAFTLTGNQAEWDWQIIPPSGTQRIIGGINWRLSASKWFPSGNIKLVDDTIKQEVPMQGVKVSVRHWFRIRTGITNGDGNYGTMGIRGKSRYFIKWKRYEFDIQTFSYGQSSLAATGGPKVRNQQWNVVLGRIGDITDYNNLDENTKYIATAFQAAHDYYYRDIEGLHRPKNNQLLNKKTKIGCMQHWDSSLTLAQTCNAFANLFTGGLGYFLPTVYLQTYKSPSEVTYGTVIHELTHSAHYAMSPDGYNTLCIGGYILQHQRAKRVMESWAVCAEIELTKLRYNRLRGDTLYVYNKPGTPNNFQSVAYNANDFVNAFYTPVFYDLIDYYNQHNDDAFYPIDRIKGFTIKQIQDIIMQCNSWGEMQDKFRAVSPTIQENGNTIILTDELFNNWQ